VREGGEGSGCRRVEGRRGRGRVWGSGRGCEGVDNVGIGVGAEGLKWVWWWE